MDKRLTNASYLIEVDPETELPVSISMTVLAGKRGSTEKKGRVIVGGEHVAFHFEYRLSDFGKVDGFKIPRAAQKLLASR